MSWDGAPVVDAGAATDATHDGRDPDTVYEYQVRSVAGTLFSGWSDAETARTPKLETPTGLALDATAPDSVTLTWDLVPAAHSYDLERMAVAGKRTTTIRGVSSGYRDEDGVTADTEYEYRVRSVRTRGTTRWESDWSGSESVTTPAMATPTPPDMPENLAAEAASSVSVDLSWDAVTGAERYDFRWRLGGAVSWDGAPVVDAGAATEATHDGRDPDTVYEYQVRSVAGTLFSGWSDAETARTPKLETPTGLTLDATAPDSVTLTWDLVPAAHSYDLERMAVAGKRTTTIRGVSSGYRDEDGVTADTEYEYRVRSVRTRGTTRWESDWSGSESVTTPAMATPTPPDMPENLAAEAASSVSVDLSWDAVTGAERYDFRWRLGGAVSWDGAPVVDAGAATEATHDGRDPDTVYEYQVRSVAGTLFSGWSDAETARTPKLETPTGLTLDATAPDSVTLTWDLVPAAHSYDLERMAVAGKRTTTIRGVSSGYRDEDGVTADTEYEYRVRSVRTRGTTRWESDWSGSESVTTPAMATAPDVPENLAAEAASPVSVDLSWDAVTGAERYDFRWRLGGAASWDGAPVVDAGAATDATHDGRDPDTVYEYQVRSVAGTLFSGWSDTEMATTPALEAPANLTAEATSAFSVSLRWEAAAGADSYRVRQQAGGQTTEFPVSGTSYEDSDLTPETTYTYDVGASRAPPVRSGRRRWTRARRPSRFRRTSRSRRSARTRSR